MANHEIVEQVTSSDGTRRVTYYKKEDSTLTYEQEKFSDEPMEMAWIPVSTQSVKIYDSLETAKKEARANIDWLTSRN